MITTHFKKLLAVVVCLLAGITAQAQFKGSTEQYPTKDYSASAIKFSLTEIATALETDTTTLATALKAYIEAEAPSPLLFSAMVDNTEVEWADSTKADSNGFWLTINGQPTKHGVNSAFYASPDVEAENDVFAFYVGQMPDVMKAGEKASAKIALKFNNKSVTFEIDLSVIEKPVVILPEPEKQISKLNIVAELTQDVEQKPRAGYDADKVEVNLTEALGKLGITDLSVVKEQLNELLFATNCYLPDDTVLGVQVLDSLTNETSANGIGFWMHAVCDAEGTETSQCARYAYDGQDKFYMESFAFDPETGMLSCNLGQYPNNLKGGQTYYTNIYIVYGDKAIKIRYNLNVLEVQLGSLDSYEKAGESTIKVEMEPQNSYDTKDFSIDIEAITTALGAAPDDFYMLQDNSFADKNQEGVGYWLDINGSIMPWGSNAMFFVTPKAEDFSKFGIGQYPNHMNIGDSVRANLYFLGDGKYYQLNIDLVIVAPKTVDNEFEVVATRLINVQQTPGEYVWTPGKEIPAEWVELQIGTSDWVLYALAPLNEDGTEKEGNAKYSKSYSITESPGFWMDGEGHNVGWNQSATRVGISIASPSGKFSLMQHPGVKLGDEFKFPLFLVNEDNGKMVEFDFTYSIVETVVEEEELEEVGEEVIVVPVDQNGAIATLDLKNVAEKLGTTVDDLAGGDYLHGMTADGTYGGGVNVLNPLSFSIQGKATIDADEVFMWFDKAELSDDGILSITTMSNEDVADDFSVVGEMCFIVEKKCYVVELKFMSNKTYLAGINDIQTAAVKLQPMFDLQGRQVKKAQRGLYIQNGRKVLVK
jgi:hypothetical protein